MLRKFTIKTRLLFGFGCVITMMILGVGTCAYIVDQTHDAITSIFRHPFTVIDASREAYTNIVKIDRNLSNAVLYGEDREELEMIITAIGDSEKNAYDRLKLVQERFLGQKEKVDDIIRELDRWRVLRAKIIGLVKERKIDKASALHQNQSHQIVSSIETKMNDIIIFAKKRAETFYATAEEGQNRAYQIVLVILAFTAVLSFFITLIITRSITIPLFNAVEIADRMAVGDMTTEIADDADDETGRLLRSMNNMLLTLKGMASTADRIASGDLSVEVTPLSEKDTLGKSMGKMIGNFRIMTSTAERIACGDLTVSVSPQSERDVLGNALFNMCRNLREQTRQIAEMINILVSSISEILASSSQLSSSYAETAASVSETTSTIEQVRQTAQVSLQKAQHVYDSAKNAVEIAQSGSKAVDETVERTNKIKAQMESIAESIVRLSEQSLAIGEIISTVNDLAEQSNLLAVNASIEAARAGEYGRAFSVVAQEVRNLAEQSKQATTQVSTILNDIRKATSRAVLVTEQGSKAVAEGMKQSIEAGGAIRTLAKNVTEASHSSSQIVASSRQQFVGMDQVAISMENIKQASSQNADSIKQVESSSKDLDALVKRLKRIHEQYKV